jgi:hypothetical protein
MCRALACLRFLVDAMYRKERGFRLAVRACIA